MQDTIGRRGTWGLCIFGSTYSLGDLLATGFNLFLKSLGISFLLSISCISFSTLFSVVCVGSFFTFSYTGSVSRFFTFSTYCKVSIITVAFPLSAGRIVMFLSSFSAFMAALSSFSRLGGGGFALLSILLMLPRGSVASSLPICRATASTAAVISIAGIFHGAGAKLSPQHRTRSSTSVSVQKERVTTEVCWLISHSVIPVRLSQGSDTTNFFIATAHLLEFVLPVQYHRNTGSIMDL